MKRLLVVLLLTVLTAGCANVPTSGPVEEVPIAERPGGIDIAPQRPAPGMSPARLIDGFLQAMVDPENDYAIARSYLAASVAAGWDTTTAVIYSGEVVATESSVRLEGTQLGALDASNRFEAELHPLGLDIALIQENGQWRIATPPDGLVLSSYLFERYYAHVPLYFMSAVGAFVVPDLIHLPEAQLTPARLVAALLNGPSLALSGAVDSAISSSVTLGPRSATIDTEGVVTVDLAGLDPSLGDEGRRFLGAQLLWTLGSLPRVTGLIVTSSGVGFSLPGANASGILDLATQHVYQVLSRSAGADLIGLRDGVVGRLPGSGEFVEMGVDTQASDIAVSLDGETAAVISPDRATLRVGPAAGQLDEVATGLTDLRAAQFVLGDLWLLGDDSQGNTRLLRVDRMLQVASVQLLLPGDAQPVTFAVSPTRSRIAISLREGSSFQLAIATLVGDDDISAAVSDFLQLATPTGSLVSDPRSVAWQAETTLVLVGSVAGQRSVFSAQIDGSGVEDLGPVPGDAQDVVALARLGGGSMALLMSGGTVWRYEARTRWTRVGDDIEAIAFGG